MTIHPDTEEFAKALAAARKAVGMSAAEDQLIPDPKLQRERYHCSPMSFVRWDSKPALGFPRAVKIGNRNHRWLSMLLEWERPVSGFSKIKKRLDAKMLTLAQRAAVEAGHDPAEVTIPPWRLHDLRRTAATGLQQFGVRLEVTEAVLNHVSGSRAGIVGVYQVHEYAEEKRAALDAWAARLQQIIAGEPAELAKVITLRAAGA